MSIANGAGVTRSNRTRVPLAVAVNCSAPLPPLTSTVSMPSPPSLRSVSSPGFQIIRSSPPWPNTWSSASPPVRVSFSPPPNSRSVPPLPSSVSLPAWPKSWSAPEPPVRTSLPAPPNRFAARQRAVRLVEADHVVAAQAEDPDQRGVGDRRRAADDGDRAAVDQDPPGRVAADPDVVGGAVADHGEYAAGERRGGGRARRPARSAKYAGGEHDAGQQAERRASPVVAMSCGHRFPSLESDRPRCEHGRFSL